MLGKSRQRRASSASSWHEPIIDRLDQPLLQAGRPEPPTIKELGKARIGTRWFNHTAEAKAGIRAAKIGKRLSQAHKVAISDGKLDYVPDQDHCDAISRGMKRWWARRKAHARR